MSWFSRLREWVRPNPDSHDPGPPEVPNEEDAHEQPSDPPAFIPSEEPTPESAPSSADNHRSDDGVAVTPDTTTKGSAVPRPSSSPAKPRKVQDIRIGLDFGTSTTLVAAKIGNQPPRVLRLESTGDEMPSYLALSGADVLIGQAAVNAAANVHSVKLALRDNEPIEDLDGMKPDKAALELIAGGLSRALDQLKRQRRLPPETERLTVSSNVGCTPAFSLEQRVRLRDVCRVAGLKVDMVNLVEEPVAAAFFASREGGARDGRTMIIDAGGGTLDVSILEVHDDATRFVLHASGGHELGGDQFTKVIERHLREKLARLRGTESDALDLNRKERTALWNEAEKAKIALSLRPRHRVPLPGTDEVVEVTSEWLEEQSRDLVRRIVAFVAEIYRRSRYTLDRTLDETDQRPGTDVFRNKAGHVTYVRNLRLEEDGLQHLDLVYFVGGASRMPLLRDRMAEIFGAKMIDLDLIGLDPVQAIVLGLAMHQPLDRVELRNPNWAVNLVLGDGRGKKQQLVPVYEPYAPLMKVGPMSQEPSTSTTIPLPRKASTAWLEFQSVLGRKSERWSTVSLPASAEEVKVTITLFGDVAMWVGNERVYVDQRSPFAARDDSVDWLPKGWRDNWREMVQDYDPRYDAYM